MIDDGLKAKLAGATSLGEVKGLLKGFPSIDPEQVWKEIENHRSSHSEKLDLEELDAVSGGGFRDWTTEGCAATCEYDSWCGSNDACIFFDVTYCNF